MKHYIGPELFVAMLGVIFISCLAGYALYRGVDGVMFGSAMAGIGGIIGWIFKGVTSKKKDNQ